jgi:acyl CoA:acetate/3-ketoacid CoA transferase
MNTDKEITFKLTPQGAELAINALDKVGGTRHLVNSLEAQYRAQVQPEVTKEQYTANLDALVAAGVDRIDMGAEELIDRIRNTSKELKELKEK